MGKQEQYNHTKDSGYGLIAFKYNELENQVMELIEKSIKKVSSNITVKVEKNENIVKLFLNETNFNYTHYTALIIKDLLTQKKYTNTDVLFIFKDSIIELNQLVKKIEDSLQKEKSHSNVEVKQFIDDVISRKKILVVDSNKEASEFLKIHLESSGYDVYVAEDGKEAIKNVTEIKPAMIITELSLPVIDGFNFITQVRETISDDIKIIVLTEKRLEEDIKKAFDVGVDDYITKPYSIVELNARLGRLMNKELI